MTGHKENGKGGWCNLYQNTVSTYTFEPWYPECQCFLDIILKDKCRFHPAAILMCYFYYPLPKFHSFRRCYHA
jgi:hypothetical protein